MAIRLFLEDNPGAQYFAGATVTMEVQPSTREDWTGNNDASEDRRDPQKTRVRFCTSLILCSVTEADLDLVRCQCEKCRRTQKAILSTRWRVCHALHVKHCVDLWPD